MTNHVVSIDIAADGSSLRCSPDAGNVTLDPAAGDTLEWHNNTDYEVNIELFQLGLGGARIVDLPRSPFDQESIVISRGGRSQHRVTSEGKALEVYKYNVSAGNLQLDPIIIVER